MALTKEDLKCMLDSQLTPLKDEIAGLKKELIDMAASLHMSNEKYEEILKKFTSHQEERAKINRENGVLKKTIEKMDEKIKQLELESNEVRQYTRRDCVEIHGIPVREQENTNKIVLSVGDQIDVYLDEKEISTSHRLPTKNYKGKRTTPPIIVKFARRDVKDRFYKARKNLKDVTSADLGYDESTANRIFINESLTEQNRNTFNASLKFKKEYKYSFIWTSNGKTYLRKDQDSRAIVINNKGDLEKLKPRQG